MMDLIVNTWNTSDPAPLSVALIIASIITAAVGYIAVALVYDKTRRPRKIAGLTIGIVTTLALATMITVTYSLPRVENPNAASYIEASGTVDTITPDLNRGGTGIRLTDHPEILLAINENEADRFAGLEDHPTTLYCKPPSELNRDDPALAAGTILDCASTPTSFRNSKLDDLLPPDIPGSAQTTTTAIHIVDEPNP